MEWLEGYNECIRKIFDSILRGMELGESFEKSCVSTILNVISECIKDRVLLELTYKVLKAYIESTNE